MTGMQKQKLDQLEDELGISRGTLPIRGESKEGYVFTEVQGVTVVITKKSYNPRGGYKVPAVRTYKETVTPTNLDAAVRAKEIFDKQYPDPSWKTGHLSPIIGTDWRCGSRACPCNTEPEPYERRLKRSIS